MLSQVGPFSASAHFDLTLTETRKESIASETDDSLLEGELGISMVADLFKKLSNTEKADLYPMLNIGLYIDSADHYAARLWLIDASSSETKTMQNLSRALLKANLVSRAIELQKEYPAISAKVELKKPTTGKRLTYERKPLSKDYDVSKSVQRNFHDRRHSWTQGMPQDVKKTPVVIGLCVHWVDTITEEPKSMANDNSINQGSTRKISAPQLSQIDPLRQVSSDAQKNSTLADSPEESEPYWMRLQSIHSGQNRMLWASKVREPGENFQRIGSKRMQTRWQEIQESKQKWDKRIGFDDKEQLEELLVGISSKSVFKLMEQLEQALDRKFVEAGKPLSIETLKEIIKNKKQLGIEAHSFFCSLITLKGNDVTPHQLVNALVEINEPIHAKGCRAFYGQRQRS
ncbi:hypothetical protein SOPP22_09685 [Shewanella sp. OPT22]|nr:hypothetical protein SOPP22_09685 [Shewanella sp. OPT22]